MEVQCVGGWRVECRSGPGLNIGSAGVHPNNDDQKALIIYVTVVPIPLWAAKQGREGKIYQAGPLGDLFSETFCILEHVFKSSFLKTIPLNSQQLKNEEHKYNTNKTRVKYLNVLGTTHLDIHFL